MHLCEICGIINCYYEMLYLVAHCISRRLLVLRILGIDPGYAIVGYGVLDFSHGNFNVVDFGAITTKAGMNFQSRLKAIYLDMCEIVETYKPDEMGIEKLFFNTNEKTAIDVAQARGVTMLPAIMPLRRMLARWRTSWGSSRLSSTSITPLFMPHQ